MTIELLCSSKFCANISVLFMHVGIVDFGLLFVRLIPFEIVSGEGLLQNWIDLLSHGGYTI
jgi:hypothetical protein